MANTCFICYSRPDVDDARLLQQNLEEANVEVFFYDPDNLWVDPVTIVIEALTEVDCVVHLNPNVMTQWKEGELAWARRNKRIIIDLNPNEIEKFVGVVQSSPPIQPMKWTRGTRFVEACGIFEDRVENDQVMDSDFFCMEDWFLYNQIYPWIPKFLKLKKFLELSDKARTPVTRFYYDRKVSKISRQAGEKFGPYFDQWHDLEKYLNHAYKVHRPAFELGHGPPTTSSMKLAHFGIGVDHNQPVGLERLRQLRVRAIQDEQRF